jgi:hypothetical protein
MVSLPTGYADLVVVAPEAELSTALRRPGGWVALHQDSPEAPGVRLEVYDAQLNQCMGEAGERYRREIGAPDAAGEGAEPKGSSLLPASNNVY